MNNVIINIKLTKRFFLKKKVDLNLPCLDWVRTE